MPRIVSKAHGEKQLRNLKTHAQQIHSIANGSTAVRKDILETASPELVEALATATRVLHTNGYSFPYAHTRRALKLISTNTAKRTKKQAVSGSTGKHSRGNKFFQFVAHHLITELPHLVAIVE